jgi:enediyne biosynthesis protein E4
MDSPRAPGRQPLAPAPWLACLGAALLLAGLLGCQQQAPAPPAPPQGAPAGPPLFQDVTDACGVDVTYRNGQEADHYAILESLGGGAAVFDFDGDGLLDLFVAGGGSYDRTDTEYQKDPTRAPRILGLPGKLYRNLGGWKFRDVTAEVMPKQALFYTHGCAVADYDRDGWPDLLVTGWGRVALYHNEPADPRDPSKGRRLVDVSERAGLTGVTWATSAAWADLDGDGFPDLYLCQYVDWSFRNNPACKGYTLKVERDVCPPKQFAGLPHMLFRNKGDGTFEDVSKSAGLRVVGVKGPDGKQVDIGKGLGVAAADFNGDRRPDIYVANDTVDNFLYLNRGSLELDEVGTAAGVARDAHAVPNGSMGVAVGDYDQSGRASIFVTNYENELHALYRNLGKAELFLYSSAVSGIGALGQSYVGFGTAFVDLDNQGREGLVISNGHVIRHPGAGRVAQRPVLLRNVGRGRFEIITPRGGDYFRRDHVGRGLVVADLDNDGFPDLVFTHVNERAAVLRNVAAQSAGRNHWLGLELAGKGNRDLVGSRIQVEAGGRKLTRFVVGGGSYLSASDPRHLFGLAGADRIDRVTVEWSWGESQSWDGKGLRVDRYWRLTEGEKAPQQSAVGRKQ